MLYKRTEYFRHTFGTPLNAKFRIMMADGTGKKSGIGDCSLIDLSPGGAKLFSTFDIPFQSGAVHIQLEFELYQVQIDVQAVGIWKKHSHNGWMYGFEFEEDLQKEQLIVDELKLFRRIEVNAQKKSEG